jgi:type II secretory pathway pseudopilin PulG
MRRGFLLMQMVVAFALLFISGISMFTTLASSDRGYTQAIQTRMALRLCNEALESLRAGTLKPTIGTQTLATISETAGRSSAVYTPRLVVSNSGSMLLVRSQVTWTEGKRTHRVELKTLVAP